MQDEVEIGFLHHPSHHHHLSHFHSSPFASSYTSAGGTHPGDNQPSSPSSSTPTSVGHQILLATTSTTGHLHQLQHQQPSHHHLLHHYAQSGQSPHTLLTNGTNGLATPPNSNQSNNETASNHSNSSSGENRSDSSKKKRKFQNIFIQFRSIFLHLFSCVLSFPFKHITSFHKMRIVHCERPETYILVTHTKSSGHQTFKLLMQEYLQKYSWLISLK